MPQADIVNIVSFVLISCFCIDIFILFFLGRLKTLIKFVYNITKKHILDNRLLMNTFKNMVIYHKYNKITNIFVKLFFFK